MSIPRVEWRPSPYFNARDARYPLQGDVSHRIVGSAPSALGSFGAPGGVGGTRKASSHFVIGHRNGRSASGALIGDAPCPQCGSISGARGPLVIYQCVDLANMAWTNGDVRDPTWGGYQAGVNPNLTTISTEHEDMAAAGRHRVTDHVWQASMALKRLLRSGDLVVIRNAGIRVGNGAFSAVQLVARMAALPVSARTYTDHHAIAGPNKPWCWRDYDLDRGFPSRLPGLLAYLAASAEEIDMPTPDLFYVPQLWRAKAGGARLREQASLSAPVVATVPADGVIFTVGEAPHDSEGWRVAVAGDPERLLYAYRAEIDPMQPTPRDPELYAGIAAVVNARVAGKPVPTGSGVSEADHRAALEQISALTRRVQDKDTHIAKYPKG